MALHNGSLAIFENNIGLSDAVLLENITEEDFIRNLRERYSADQIYTYIGTVVVSVNPYQKVPLYTHSVIEEYRSRNIYELPPHIYAIADGAYRSMRDRNLDQCIIISGESGSGKTEASKVIMQYVAEVSGKGKDIDQVKEQLLQSNPVLEAFGNAKTTRNDNSSRFGKYMDIEFDFKGDPIGGVITNYLLEKSRVAVQASGERNFHIFYQLLSGAETSVLKSLKLSRNPDSYAFLKNSGCTEMDTMDDKKNFNAIKNGMEVIGFQAKEITAVFQLVASILKLGNVEFHHQVNMDGTDGCKMINDYEIEDVSSLLGCAFDDLCLALTHRSVEVKGEKVLTDLSTGESTYARDALCKAIYSRMFTWLVQRINDSIRVKKKGKAKVMGVLDIYGFEVFQSNGFEQFIINYCNEKLQQIFIELTLKEEQQEYIKEGIEWIHVDYFNNAVICELIEKNNEGILAMLDEECLRPGTVTDQTFLEKLNQTCCEHPHYENRSLKKSQADKTLPHDMFRLKHYAGAVTYVVDGFLDKNNDLLFRDLSQAMYNCSHPLLKELFPDGNPSQISLKRPATTGSQFKSSVTELMKNLSSKNPNYIRCIKPNDFKKPHNFDMTIVTHQVRYLGLLENVRVRRAGYAFRQLYGPFLNRYKMLAPETWPRWSGPAQEGVKVILTAQKTPSEDYAFGKSKLFIKNPRTLFELEERRRDHMHYLAVLIQKVWKGYKQKRLFSLMKASQVMIAKHFRGFWAKKCFQQKKRAAVTIQSYNRGMRARLLLQQLKREKRVLWAANIIHKYYRGWKVRIAYRSQFKAIAGPKVIRYIRTALRKRFLIHMREHLPTMSPTSKNWPRCSLLYREASQELRQIFHKWRCYKYRQKFDQAGRYKMREKVTASDLFKNKKANYPSSVPHPFKGDYLNLRQNLRWKKLYEPTQDQHLMFADMVMKVNRANGKMIQQLFVISSQALLLIDHRTMSIKYRIPLANIQRISLSPFLDKLVVFHLFKQNSTDRLTKKGDFVFSSEHVIEIVSKSYLLVQNHTEKPPEVSVSQQFMAEFNGINVELSFKLEPQSLPNFLPGMVKIVRKGNRFDVLQP